MICTLAPLSMNSEFTRSTLFNYFEEISLFVDFEEISDMAWNVKWSSEESSVVNDLMDWWVDLFALRQNLVS